MQTIRSTFAVLLALLGGHGVLAQPAFDPLAKDFQIVQRIDDVLIGVDTITLGILDSRYVVGSYFLINMRKPSPIAGRAEFVADCQNPLRIATLTSTLPSGSLSLDAPILPPRRGGEAIDVKSLAFSAVHMLDGTWMAADFACQATSQPGRVSQLARRNLEEGGPPDMETLYCDLQSDGNREVRRGVQIRFSDSEDAVVVNRQWLSSGYVTDTAVVFGSAAQWVVDRSAREARLIAADGKRLFTGACDKRPPATLP